LTPNPAATACVPQGTPPCEQFQRFRPPFHKATTRVNNLKNLHLSWDMATTAVADATPLAGYPR
jgi:hypothetical protein